MAVCTGCSLLCEDIEVVLEGGKISKTKNLCRKGLGHFRSVYTERCYPKIDGAKASPDQAIAYGAEILAEAKRPMLFGWSNSTLEAQTMGIEMAKSLGAFIDDTSSFCQGPLMERVLRGEVPSCTLDDVRNFADVIVFWGSDPSSSHPRHMSRFSFFPRGEKRQKGYEEDRTGVVIDVRESPTAKLVRPYKFDGYFRIPPGGDADMIQGITAVLDGKIPKVEDKKRILSLVSMLKKAKFGTIFPGLGMVYSMKDGMDLFVELVSKLNQVSRFSVIPMVGHYNMRGFNQKLLEETGHTNRVRFSPEISHGPKNSIVEASKECDAALIIGSDPLSALPAGIAKRLAKVPVIAIDPHLTLTTEVAKVAIPTALSGLEAGGSALRMDGVKIDFSPVVEAEAISDAEILARIKEAM
jgi:formylmethanofuran dehydrogenase subunit B